MIELDPLQRDALLEVFNVGIGQAAASLSQIVGEPIRLSLITMRFVPPSSLLPDETVQAQQPICAVSQTFRGVFEATGMLMFPEERTLEIVRRMIGEPEGLNGLTALEQEAMCEIGNVVLNACVSSIANLFETRISSSLPRYHLGSLPDILAGARPGREETVLLLHLDMLMELQEIKGYIAFVLDTPNLRALVQEIDQFIGRVREYTSK